MQTTMGFVTVATGDEHYYRIANNLRRSYRLFSSVPLPFAIICDRENRFTEGFDKVILLKSASFSYLDKLCLYDCLPYDISIFIDADCLAYGDLNHLFTYFETADDFSCMGRVLPLDDKTGWFNYEDLDQLQQQVSYCVGLHGGIYYIRRSEKAKAVFDTAKEIARDYHRYHFKGNFSSPGDEPVLALSMALNHCRPTQQDTGLICCYWEVENAISLSPAKGKARLLRENKDTILVHWGTRFTRDLLYEKQIAIFSCLETGSSSVVRFLTDLKFSRKLMTEKVIRLLNRVLRKGKRLLHLS